MPPRLRYVVVVEASTGRFSTDYSERSLPYAEAAYSRWERLRSSVWDDSCVADAGVLFDRLSGRRLMEFGDVPVDLAAPPRWCMVHSCQDALHCIVCGGKINVKDRFVPPNTCLPCMKQDPRLHPKIKEKIT